MLSGPPRASGLGKLHFMSFSHFVPKLPKMTKFQGSFSLTHQHSVEKKERKTSGRKLRGSLAAELRWQSLHHRASHRWQSSVMTVVKINHIYLAILCFGFFSNLIVSLFRFQYLKFRTTFGDISESSPHMHEVIHEASDVLLRCLGVGIMKAGKTLWCFSTLGDHSRLGYLPRKRLSE